jgi:hypothetical protein
MRDGSRLISGFFVCVYVIFGVILVLTAVSGIVRLVIGEIKLQRECVRPVRDAASAGPPARWERTRSTEADRLGVSPAAQGLKPSCPPRAGMAAQPGLGPEGEAISAPGGSARRVAHRSP